MVYGVPWNSGEGRKIVQFADEASAMEEARLKAAQLSAGRIEGVEMGRAERDTLQAAQKIAGDFPILAAIEEWRKARDLTQGHLLIAAEVWAAGNGTSYETIAANADYAEDSFATQIRFSNLPSIRAKTKEKRLPELELEMG